MSDIEDEAYTELCLENERLKNEILELGHMVKLSEYQKVQALCARAADRIYMWVDAGLDPSMETKDLIAELRKAAE
jgi:hypothetical protein